MAKTQQIKLDKLTPDNLNANKGTEYGGHLIEKSLRSLGAGRSILLDKNNKIIAGNKTVENAAAIGLENVIIVETTGDQIVAVKRMDIDIDSQRGRELAIADNATSKANLSWDMDVIQEIEAQWSITPEDWGIRTEGISVDFGEDSKDGEENNPYTNKIKAPVYEPTGEIPRIEELCDEAKADELVRKIMSADINAACKRFLSLAAKRHLVFNYEKIAEFYAHADKNVQVLMEDSALIIIDFDKAIEKGYVKLSQSISCQYDKDNDEE